MEQALRFRRNPMGDCFLFDPLLEYYYETLAPLFGEWYSANTTFPRDMPLGEVIKRINSGLDKAGLLSDEQ